MSVYFFATTQEDLLPVLEVIEAQFDIKYVSSEWFVTPDIPVSDSAREIPDLGYCKWGNSCSSYYIIPRAQKILVEYMPNRIVPEKYSFERKIPSGNSVGGVGFGSGAPTYVLNGLLYHEGSAGGVYFRSGGLYSGEGGPALLQGSFDLLSHTPESLALFNALKKEIRRQWVRIQESYVAPEAERLLDQGMRLAQDIQAPRGTDIPPSAERVRPKTPKTTVAAAKSKNTKPKTRLSYEDSCRRLQPDYLEAGVIPPIPERMPQFDDPEPLGVSFFRTSIGEGDDLSNLTLPRTFFGKSEINDALFQNTDLTESNLCWNDFVDVDFTDAILARSDLRASLFNRVKFVRTDLRGADMRQSSFEDCDFENALMTGAILTAEQGAELNLSEEQRGQISWTNEDGPEPGGG